MAEGDERGRGAILVLAHVGDRTAAAAATSLRRRFGTSAVLIVTPEELILAPLWAHHLDHDGVRTRIRLASGDVIGEPPPLAVLNRIRFVRPPQFELADATDREYATMELHALLLSWLASMSDRVVNPASPRGLGGAERSNGEWLRLAHGAGFRVRRRWTTTDARNLGDPARRTEHPRLPPRGTRPGSFEEPLDTQGLDMVVLDDVVLGAPSAAVAAKARRLAATAGCRILSIQLGRSPDTDSASADDPDDGWLVCGADPVPELVTEPGLSCLVDLVAGIACRPEPLGGGP